MNETRIAFEKWYKDKFGEPDLMIMYDESIGGRKLVHGEGFTAGAEYMLKKIKSEEELGLVNNPTGDEFEEEDEEQNRLIKDGETEPEEDLSD